MGTQQGSFPAIGRINWFPHSGRYEDKLVSSCYRSIAIFYLVKLNVLILHYPETIPHRNSLPKPEEDMGIQHSTIWNPWDLEAAEGDYY